MNLTGSAKTIVGYSIAGIAFAVLTTIAIGLLNATIGLNFDNNVQGIITALFSGDPMAIIFTAITAIIFGAFIWGFGYIGAMLKSKATGGTVTKIGKRPHIVGFFLMGIIGVGIFGIVDQVLAGVGTSTDPVGLLSFDNPMGIAIQFIAYSVLGFVVIWLGSKFTALEKPVPDSLKKF